MTKETTESICAIVCASSFNAAAFKARRKAGTFACVIAVDGGYDWLTECAVTPDILIGDFDSISATPMNLTNTEVVEFPPEKDASDFELAMDYAANAGYRRVEVYGALGGRIDHSISVLQVMAKFAESGIAVTVVAPECQATLLVGPASIDIPAGYGVVSVFALTPKAEGVCEKGLKYPLQNATITNRESLGLSNELIGAQASISVESGTLVVFHPLVAEA